MSHDDFAFEPIPGLPAELPRSESLLWQGSPDWKSLAIRAYHVRKIAVYFLALVLWRIGDGLYEGHEASAIAVSCLFLAALCLLAIGVLSLLAYLNARSAVYSITSRRVLLRHGVAVPMTMNLPLKFIDCAALKTFSNGTGDIALKLPKEQRISYLITWPHLRPGRVTRPEPSFRALRDARTAAQVLSAALTAQIATDSAGVPPNTYQVNPGAAKPSTPHSPSARPRSAEAA